MNETLTFHVELLLTLVFCNAVECGSLIIFDTESDDLVDKATKFWIMGWTSDGEDYKTTTDPDLMMEVLSSNEAAGCHNSLRHDFPLFEKLHGYHYKGLKIDTLFLSWYLFPKAPKHGLEEWGELLGYPKVQVDPGEWKSGNIPLMEKRVTRDVEINWKLWKKQERLLNELYS